MWVAGFGKIFKFEQFENKILVSIKMSASWGQESFQAAIPLTQKSFKVSSSKLGCFGIKAFKLGSF